MAWNKEKIDKQKKNTDGYCHARAHAVATYLNQEGIECTKVFKYWAESGYDSKNLNAWEKLDQTGLLWWFHCAVMITSSEGKHLIWDPWAGSREKLLSLADWFFYNHGKEAIPKPKRLEIHNSQIIAAKQTLPSVTNPKQLGYAWKYYDFMLKNMVPDPSFKPDDSAKEPVKDKACEGTNTQTSFNFFQASTSSDTKGKIRKLGF